MSAVDFEPGDSVVYQPYPGGPREDGVVVRTNERLVFVRYRDSETPKGTAPEMLERVR